MGGDGGGPETGDDDDDDGGSEIGGDGGTGTFNGGLGGNAPNGGAGGAAANITISTNGVVILNRYNDLGQGAIVSGGNGGDSLGAGGIGGKGSSGSGGAGGAGGHGGATTVGGNVTITLTSANIDSLNGSIAVSGGRAGSGSAGGTGGQGATGGKGGLGGAGGSSSNAGTMKVTTGGVITLKDLSAESQGAGSGGAGGAGGAGSSKGGDGGNGGAGGNGGNGGTIIVTGSGTPSTGMVIFNGASGGAVGSFGVAGTPGGIPGVKGAAGKDGTPGPIPKITFQQDDDTDSASVTSSRKKRLFAYSESKRSEYKSVALVENILLLDEKPIYVSNSFVAPVKDLRVGTSRANIRIAAGAVAFVADTGRDVSILALHESKSGDVTVEVDGKSFQLHSGEELVVSDADSSSIISANPLNKVPSRNQKQIHTSNNNVMVCEFSIGSALSSIKPLSKLAQSGSKTELASYRKILKNAALIQTLRANRGVFRQHS